MWPLVKMILTPLLYTIINISTLAIDLVIVAGGFLCGCESVSWAVWFSSWQHLDNSIKDMEG